MSQTNINIRMDAELKKEFEQFCADVGMSMTTAFCIFAKTAVKTQSIPFEITNNHHFYGKENQKRLRKSIKQLNDGLGVEHEVFYEEDLV